MLPEHDRYNLEFLYSSRITCFDVGPVILYCFLCSPHFVEMPVARPIHFVDKHCSPLQFVGVRPHQGDFKGDYSIYYILYIYILCILYIIYFISYIYLYHIYIIHIYIYINSVENIIRVPFSQDLSQRPSRCSFRCGRSTGARSRMGEKNTQSTIIVGDPVSQSTIIGLFSIVGFPLSGFFDCFFPTWRNQGTLL